MIEVGDVVEILTKDLEWGQYQEGELVIVIGITNDIDKDWALTTRLINSNVSGKLRPAGFTLSERRQGRDYRKVM